MARKSRRAEASDLRGDGSGEAQDSGSSAESVTQRIRTLLDEQDIIARIVQLVPDIYGPNALYAAWDEFSCSASEIVEKTLLEFSEHTPFLELFTSWLTHSWTAANLASKPEGLAVPDSAPTRIFLTRHPDLDPLLARYLEACIATPFGFFEVLQSEPGRRFTCRDLARGTQDVVIDSAAAALLRPGQVVYARIVEVDGVAVMDASAPWALPEYMQSILLAFRRLMLNRPSGAAEAGRAPQSPLARDLDLRSLYWGFVEGAPKDGCLLPQLGYNYELHRAAERLLALLASGKTAAEMLSAKDLN